MEYKLTEEESENSNSEDESWFEDYYENFIKICKIDDYQKYHDILKNKIILMITNDLTIGRDDNKLKPYTPEQITNFINENNDKIEKTIQTIIYDYHDDDELELLEDPLFDQITEYLYQFVIL